MSSYRSNPIGLLYHATRYYRLFKQAETWSRDRLEAYQLKKLQEIADYAFLHVPYYRDAYAREGFRPGDIRTFQDFRKLPHLTKQDLRTEPPERFLSDEAKRLSISYVRTSGSTGIPLSFACGLRSRAANYAATFRAFHAAGYNLGDVQFILKNLPGLKGTCSFSPISRQLCMHAYHLEKTALEAVMPLLQKHPPKHVVTHPNALLELVRVLPNVQELFSKVKGITSLAEVLTPEVRQSLEEIFHCKVFDYYSNMESSIMAYQLENGEKVFAEYFCYPELEDTDSDPWQGELTTTALHCYAQPLIRYRNEDQVSLRPATKEDSSHLLHLESVHGRTAERIKLPSGTTIGIFHLLKADLTNVSAYQFVQTAPDALEVHYIKSEQEAPVNEESMLAELASYTNHEMRLAARQVPVLRKTAAGKVPRAIVIKQERKS